MAELVARAGGGPRLTREQTVTLRRALEANDRTVAVHAYRAMIAFDSRPWIGGITAPTLIVCGSVDHTSAEKVPSPLTIVGGPEADVHDPSV